MTWKILDDMWNDSLQLSNLNTKATASAWNASIQTSPVFLKVSAAGYRKTLDIWVNMVRAPQWGRGSHLVIWCLVNPAWAFSILIRKCCSLLHTRIRQAFLREAKIEPTPQFKFLESFPWTVPTSVSQPITLPKTAQSVSRWSSLTP